MKFTKYLKKPVINSFISILHFFLFLSVFNFTLYVLIEALQVNPVFIQVVIQLAFLIMVVLSLLYQQSHPINKKPLSYLVTYIYLFVPAYFLYLSKLNSLTETYLYATLMGVGLFAFFKSVYFDFIVFVNKKMFQFVLDEQYPAQQKSKSNIKIKQVTHPNKFMIAIFDDSLKENKVSEIFNPNQYEVTLINSSESLVQVNEWLSTFDLVIIHANTFYQQGLTIVATIRELVDSVTLPILLIVEQQQQADIGLTLGANETISYFADRKVLFEKIKYFEQLKRIKQESAFTQLMFNQSQIKPHFLFNTLSVIVSLIDTQPQKARKVLLDFSDFLRYSFDFKTIDGLIDIQQEIRLIKVYVAIELARHQQNLSVDLEIDDQLDVMVPLLSIQPLVENAINHGALMSTKQGYVRLTICKVDDGVRVEVFDNGKGFKQKDILEIYNETISKGVGVVNIQKRLKAYYKKGLHIESKEGEYTKVSFLIPKTEVT